jgi:hypothetical protein
MMTHFLRIDVGGSKEAHALLSFLTNECDNNKEFAESIGGRFEYVLGQVR